MEEMRGTDAVRARITAAAQAVWRVSEPDWFDPSLREEIRRSAASAIGAVGALSAGAPSREAYGIDTALGAIAATEGLICFARDRAPVRDENAPRTPPRYRSFPQNIL